jgi:hypothetical protein
MTQVVECLSSKPSTRINKKIKAKSAQYCKDVSVPIIIHTLDVLPVKILTGFLQLEIDD